MDAAGALTNVPASTANVLSYAILVVVAVYLISGPLITYYFWKKNKKPSTAQPTEPAA
jgi:hypothetical protein